MIKRLSSQVIREIAAGEVIERPASILKELIENSIDAGASRIEVEYLDGGIQEIRVRDNGFGIAPSDLPLVFENHATSKINKLEDFESLSSMGFRGEAMSSIAAVSKVLLVSSREVDEESYQVEVQHGKWLGTKPTDKSMGTQVRVSEVFAKLPVRQKFLKSPASEARALHQVFRRYVLCHPEISWRLAVVDGAVKEEHSLATPFERFLWFFGIENQDWAFETIYESLDTKIHFMGLKPRYLRPNRLGVQIFLNHRPIKDRGLEFAIRRAFEGYAERTNEVSGCLFLNLSPSSFDVNVHPAKTEVRFLHQEKLFSSIVHGIREGLEKIHKGSGDLGARYHEKFTSNSAEALAAKSSSSGSMNLESQSKDYVNMSTWGPRGAEDFFTAKADVGTSDSEEIKSEQRVFNTATEGVTAEVEMKSRTIASLGFHGKFELLGIVERSFLVAKKNEELYLFDQHALHERVLYEELRDEMDNKHSLPSQRLLFPVQLKMDEYEGLLEQEELIRSLGFEIREWKSNKIQVIAVPALLKKNFEQALNAILECSVQARDSILREALATIACHSAIRVHDFISDEEAKRILDRFDSEDALGHCPHGRPTFVRLGKRDLEKFFHR